MRGILRGVVLPVSIKIRLMALIVFVLFPFAVSCQNESTSTASLPIPASLLNPEKSPDKQITEIPAKALLLTEQAFIRVAKQVTPSVVNISSVHFVRHPDLQSPEDRGFFQGFLKDFFQKAPRRQFRQKSLGSGFIISEEGFILTNHHVVSEADQITVRLSDRREFIGKVVGKDPERDLAMIKIVSRGGLPIAMLGDSRQIEVGAWAIAIGNPFGLDRTVTVGVISATGRNHLGLPEQGEFLQTDASINFGNSGSPLLNVAGEVIGINTAIIASGQGIGFAIPIDAVKEIIRDWIDNAPVKQG